MKIYSLILIAIGLSAVSQAEQAPDLNRLMALINVKYPPMETLEQVAVQLHYYDANPPSLLEEPKLLEALKTLSNGYAANVHFRQAYNIFQRYLNQKEKILARQKAEILSKARQEYQQKDKADADKLIGLQTQVDDLKMETDGFISRRSAFKKIFSAIIVVLTFLFAISLVRSGVRLKKLLEDTKLNHNKLMANHRIASLGHLKDGIESTIHDNNQNLKNSSAEAASIIGRSGISNKQDMLDLISQLSSNQGK